MLMIINASHPNFVESRINPLLRMLWRAASCSAKDQAVELGD
jgi:hypothetical protein